ncbi:response regulator [candidate division KSB1 bacterium]|nr:response regulator [candidate division KSB1 bacterium]
MAYKLLVVDDEAQILSALDTYFTLRGYEVTTCLSPVDALDLISRSKFHVALCDINMPVMSGIELLRKIKDARPTVQVVMMTAYTTIEKAIECVEHGASDYLLKPFPEMKDLENVVRLASERVARWERVAAESLRNPRDVSLHKV